MTMSILTVQRTLFRLGYDPGGCDGADGPKTEAALAAFAHDHDTVLVTRNEIEPILIEAASHLDPLILSQWTDGAGKLQLRYTPANRPHSSPIDLIVIHTMEAPEKPKTAHNVAAWFASKQGPQASAHYCVDDEEIIQCVLECDVAWHAPGVNNNGIGIEHAGFASQTPEQWDDDYSLAVLAKSAELSARLVRRFSIPIQKLSVSELANHGRGFVGHVDATNAFCNGHGHTDPGIHFPWDKYLDMVRAAAGG